MEAIHYSILKTLFKSISETCAWEGFILAFLQQKVSVCSFRAFLDRCFTKMYKSLKILIEKAIQGSSCSLLLQLSFFNTDIVIQ